MFIFKRSEDLSVFIKEQRNNNLSIGFVPTMGALHKGHCSLIELALQSNDIVVCSIFVNPAQFDNEQDLDNYPRTIDYDIEVLASCNCQVLFLPSVDEIYPHGINKTNDYKLGNLDKVLEGLYRPGHFQGVAMVIERLLNIINPKELFLGQKDYQQCFVIKKIIEQSYPDVSVEIAPTLREEDGLAFSSRNARLTDPQRAVASLIYQCLISVQAQKDTKDFSIVRNECMDIMLKKGLKPEYIELADADTFTLMDKYSNENRQIVLIACWIGNVRLIDNLVL